MVRAARNREQLLGGRGAAAEAGRPAYSALMASAEPGPPASPGHEYPGQSEDAGQQDGVAAAYSAHRAELLGFARRSLGDTELAEDAVQETFARAWRARRLFNPRLGAMRAWLFAIERHIVVDLARLRGTRSTQPLGNNVPSAGDPLDDALRAAMVEQAVRGLTPLHREVIVEIYFRGRSSRELADELGLPDGTVRSRLYYALRALRARLAAQGWEP